MPSAKKKPSDMPNQLGLLPIIGWAVHSEPSENLVDFVRTRLADAGVLAEHFQVMQQLDIQCNANIAWWLEMKERKQDMLNVLSILSRARLGTKVLSTITVKQLTQLRLALALIPQEMLPDGAVVSLAKALMARSLSIEDKAILSGAVKWWVQCSSMRKVRSWERIKETYLRSLTWTLPCPAIPTNVKDVIVEPLLTGEMVHNEGQRMGNCLSGQLVSYVYFATAGIHYIFHLHDARHPLVCATLLIGKSPDEKFWAIREFETVGRGKPPANLQGAADVVLEAFQTTVMGPRRDEEDGAQ